MLARALYSIYAQLDVEFPWHLPVSQVWHCLCCLPVTYTSVILSLLVYLLLLLLAFKPEIKVSQLGFSLFMLLCVTTSLVLLINVLFSCFRCSVAWPWPSLWLARWPGTCYLTVFVIRRIYLRYSGVI